MVTAREWRIRHHRAEPSIIGLLGHLGELRFVGRCFGTQDPESIAEIDEPLLDAFPGHERSLRAPLRADRRC